MKSETVEKIKSESKYPCIICKKILTIESNECCDTCMFQSKPKNKK